MAMTRVLSLSSASIFVLALAACQRRAPEPETHPAPVISSDPPPAAFLAPQTSPHAVTPAAAPAEQKGQLKWSDPPGWVRLDQSSPMRLATYRVPHAAGDKDDAELAVFHFGGGQGGDVEANLSRWEHQFGDVKPGASRRTERTVNGLKAHVLEIESGTYTAMAMAPGQSPSAKSEYGMLATVVETPLGSYFFKMTGPVKTVKAQKDAFMTMLDGVKVAP